MTDQPAGQRRRPQPTEHERRRHAGAGAEPGALVDLLGAAVAGARRARDRRRAVPRRLLARAVAVAAADRPRHRARRVLPARGRGVRAAVHGALAEPHTTACAGSTATAAGRTGRRPRSPTRSRRRPRMPSSLALWRAHVERALRAGQDAEGRRAGAARRAPRSVCAARAGRRAGGRDVLRRRRRPHEAHRRGLRLAGRRWRRPISASTPG